MDNSIIIVLENSSEYKGLMNVWKKEIIIKKEQINDKKQSKKWKKRKARKGKGTKEIKAMKEKKTKQGKGRKAKQG